MPRRVEPFAPASTSEPIAPELHDRLRRRAEPDGFLPFERLMDVALYDPEVGYYARSRSPFGPDGDYYTAARVHPIFARTVAARVARVREAVGRPRPFHVIDLGSGDGTLLAGVARALVDRDAADGVDFVAVDRSAARRGAALRAVDPVARDAGASVRAVPTIAELGPVAGFVLAHELLDAQPVRRLTWDGTGWAEGGFVLAGDRLVATEHPVAGAVPPPPLPVLGPEDAGVIVEVAPMAAAIVREVADHLTEGVLAIVDFGDEEGALRAAHPRGTVAAVRRHRPLASVTEGLGTADLSAFVNFTRLRFAAGRAGLVELAFRSQAEALGAWGFPVELEGALRESGGGEGELRVRLAAKNLLFGFDTFRVLELAAPTSAAAQLEPTGAERSGPT